MTELYGLKVILSDAVEKGTLHTMRMPPARGDYVDDVEYQHAHDEWWNTMHLWAVTVKNIGDD